MIKVVIVEDSPVVRQGLIQMLGRQPDMLIAGEATNGLEAIDLLRNGTVADLLLTDLNMLEMNGIEMTEYVNEHFPGNKVVILTMHARRKFMEKAYLVGAKGYVLKDETDELLDAIRLVHEGETYFKPMA